MTQGWRAPVASAPVRATVAVPGSKSITNRALLLAALADRPSILGDPLVSRDTALMADALRALGVRIEESEPVPEPPPSRAVIQADGSQGGGVPGTDVPGATTTRRGAVWAPRSRNVGFRNRLSTWRVTPGRLHGGAAIDCGLAGTVMRFLPPAAAIADGEVRFDGDPRARERPMGTILGALRDLGAKINGDALPFVLSGTGHLPGGVVTIDASASSQFVSGLLLAGARYDKGLTVRHDGKPVPSLPHIVMTVRMLRAAGVDVDDSEPNVWHVDPGAIRGMRWPIEPDLSNATPFLAAAAVTGGRVTVPGWPESTTQPGELMREILARMGCQVVLDEHGLTVTGTGTLTGIDVDLRAAGELAPTVAAVAALASGPSTLRGIAHLRGHETDRLAALSNEINNLGGNVAETEDGLVIRPKALRAGSWGAYADHRMATAGAIIGLVVDGVEVDDIATTGKTMPDFPAMWAAMLEPEPGRAEGLSR